MANRSSTVTIEVSLTFEHAFFIFKKYFLFRSIKAKNRLFFLEKGTCTKLFGAYSLFIFFSSEGKWRWPGIGDGKGDGDG